ncbi:hypothetical protein SAMN05192559_105256 [Halobacillus karajensis]|uniref:Uncharacterized protein n=1 Tax=Halobacillus karajensis TaxID=195088 RepID=A0A024P4S2_9BACI|nr:hypothetical protein BN982_02823 [Halobacillus karajensis]CDQ24049.1 hypothetical protein BN983_02314 [Halobacillus karajensis]CDQ27527.1 hypothetical protein BN981_01795 [Halobacillus karajensis]SEH91058.1 hypothetical protein SAMN05192559_105256 [Halobacillus karajensis]
MRHFLNIGLTVALKRNHIQDLHFSGGVKDV